MAMEPVLPKETEVFDAHLDEWRSTQMGRFVLIKGEQVVGFYDSLTDAFAEGSKLYGLGEFFIKQIIPRDSVNISLLGKYLRSAHP